MSSMPNCIILPSVNGSQTNCIQIPLPSTGKIITLLAISWIIFMIVAWIIYKFLNRQGSKEYGYWKILGILLLSGIILSLLSNLIMKFNTKK